MPPYTTVSIFIYRSLKHITNLCVERKVTLRADLLKALAPHKLLPLCGRPGRGGLHSQIERHPVKVLQESDDEE